MSTLVFIDLNKSKISESSAQAATIANQLDDKVYGLTTYNDDDYISSLGNKGFDKVFKIFKPSRTLAARPSFQKSLVIFLFV